MKTELTIHVHVLKENGHVYAYGHTPDEASIEDVLVAGASLLDEVVLNLARDSTAPMRKIRADVLDKAKGFMTRMQASEMNGTPYVRNDSRSPRID